MPEHKMRNLIGGVEIEGQRPATFAEGCQFDNLAIMLCTYFDGHPDCPEEQEDDETGWKPWVIDRCNEMLDAIAAEIEGETDERIVKARASLLKVWPRGKDCEHQHAREAFEALGDA